jgi:hypothetical protein
MIVRHRRHSLIALAFVTMLGAARPALAAGDDASAIESAATHFHHGVSLYKDGDYEAALVEFRRAQELSPNYRVLYDIGQSLYLLQRYAEALEAFEAYLAQGGTQLAPARRASVEADLKALRGRVGYLEIVVNVEGADIRVDDRVVGRSPLAQPLLVSVGHRKVSVVKSDRVPVERFIDVAVGDRTKLAFDLPTPAVASTVPAPKEGPLKKEEATVAEPTPPQPLPPESSSSGSLIWVPWAATAALAIGTGVTGALALTSKASLSNDIATFPGSASAINQDRSRAQTFAVASDVFLGATAVALGVAVYVTLRPHRAQTSGAGIGLRLGFGEIRLQGDF